MGKTVLVIEDEHALRDIMMWSLQNKDYDVLVAETAEEGLPLVEKADLVLLNLKLPGMSVDKFIEKVRSTGNFTPMIVVTGFAIDEKLKDKLGKYKIVDWVAKPFSTSNLLERVNKALVVSDNMAALPDFTARLKGFIRRQGVSSPTRSASAASML